MHDILNKKYNNLLVIAEHSRDRFGKIRYRCQCDCGREKVLEGSRVSRGIIKSCGCLRLRTGKHSPRFKGYEEILGEFWCHIQRNAKKRKIIFDITIQQAWRLFLQQNRVCALSGLPISFQKSIHATLGTASLDRIDSTRGYTLDNIQWVHKDINWMKQDYSQEEFLNYCRLVVAYDTPVNA